MPSAAFIWTFLIQTINFALVVFILYKLLYKPVRRIVQQRQDAIAKQMDDARKTGEEARKLHDEYQQKLAAAQAEAQKLRTEAAEHADLEAQATVQKARDEARKLRQAAQDSIRRERLRAADDLSGQVVTAAGALAGAMAGAADLHGLHERAIGEVDRLLAELDDDDRMAAATELSHDSKVHVRSAAELSDPHKQRLAAVLGDRLGVEPPQLEVELDDALVAGVEVRIGGLILKAHWRDQIRQLLAGPPPTQKPAPPQPTGTDPAPTTTEADGEAQQQHDPGTP